MVVACIALGMSGCSEHELPAMQSPLPQLAPGTPIAVTATLDGMNLTQSRAAEITLFAPGEIHMCSEGLWTEWYIPSKAGSDKSVQGVSFSGINEVLSLTADHFTGAKNTWTMLGFNSRVGNALIDYVEGWSRVQTVNGTPTLAYTLHRTKAKVTLNIVDADGNTLPIKSGISAKLTTNTIASGAFYPQADGTYVRLGDVLAGEVENFEEEDVLWANSDYVSKVFTLQAPVDADGSAVANTNTLTTLVGSTQTLSQNDDGTTFTLIENPTFTDDEVLTITVSDAYAALTGNQVGGTYTLRLKDIELPAANGQEAATKLTALHAGDHLMLTVKLSHNQVLGATARLAEWSEASADGTANGTNGPQPITHYELVKDAEGNVTGYKVYTDKGLLAWNKALADVYWDDVIKADLSLDLTLMCDITLPAVAEGESNWTAVGFQGNGYTGTIDGNGFTLSGLTIDQPASYYQGLVGYLGEGGVVKNLTLADAKVSGGYYVGGIVGYNVGSVTDCSSAGTVSGDDYVGGIVGSNDGSVTNCSNAGTVSAPSLVGGIAGYNDGSVTGCVNMGEVSGRSHAGGIVGINYDSVSGCGNAGGIICYDQAGGIVGANHYSVSGCSNAGEVSGLSFIGGIAGEHTSEVSDTWTILTKECDSSGEVEADNGIGYEHVNGEISNCILFNTPSEVTSEDIDEMNTALTNTAYQWTAGTNGGWPTLQKISAVE